MIDKNTLVKVTNRSNGTVGYSVPDLGNLVRTFQRNETKEVTFEELQKLSYLPGGDCIMQNYLRIDNKEAQKALLGDVEPEYFYSEADVIQLLEKGSVDQLLDCLDFAPDGIISLIKDKAVELEIPDVRKRDAILQKTGFNVTRAIEIEKESKEEEQITQTIKTNRRAAPISKPDDNIATRRVVAKDKK